MQSEKNPGKAEKNNNQQASAFPFLRAHSSCGHEHRDSECREAVEDCHPDPDLRHLAVEIMVDQPPAEQESEPEEPPDFSEEGIRRHIQER